MSWIRLTLIIILKKLNKEYTISFSLDQSINKYLFLYKF